MKNNNTSRLLYFLNFGIVNSFQIDLTKNPSNNKRKRGSDEQNSPTDEDEEERMTMEFNNRYTFT